MNTLLETPSSEHTIRNSQQWTHYYKFPAVNSLLETPISEHTIRNSQQCIYYKGSIQNLTVALSMLFYNKTIEMLLIFKSKLCYTSLDASSVLSVFNRRFCQTFRNLKTFIAQHAFEIMKHGWHAFPKLDYMFPLNCIPVAVKSVTTEL